MTIDPLADTRITPLPLSSTCGELDGIETGVDPPEPRIELLRQALHDMGSPLSVMRILVELLRLTGSRPESRDELIEMLDNQVADLGKRVEGLLKEVARGNPE
jgi:K+-sensing histidine kinase KdpD